MAPLNIDRELDRHRRIHARIAHETAQLVGLAWWAPARRMSPLDWAVALVIALALLPVVLGWMGLLPSAADLPISIVAPEVFHSDDELVLLSHDIRIDGARRRLLL